MVDVVVARIADAPAGYHRVLVDRLWPRGVRKDQAPWDEWIQDVAPSAALRRWYGHEPDRYLDFRQRYEAELRANAAHPGMLHLLELIRDRPVALLTATRNLEQSQVPILAGFVRQHLGGGQPVA